MVNRDDVDTNIGYMGIRMKLAYFPQTCGPYLLCYLCNYESNERGGQEGKHEPPSGIETNLTP